MLWVLKRTVSIRQFFWAPKTYVQTDGLEYIYNFTLKTIVYLNLCTLFEPYAVHTRNYNWKTTNQLISSLKMTNDRWTQLIGLPLAIAGLLK